MLDFVSFILFIELCAVGSICFYLLSGIYDIFMLSDSDNHKNKDIEGEYIIEKISDFYEYTPITNEEYSGILTIFDYETPLEDTLSFFARYMKKRDKKILVDNLIKQGVNKYRFVSYSLRKNEIATPSYLDEILLKKANEIWKEHRDVLKGSIITPSIQKDLFKE